MIGEYNLEAKCYFSAPKRIMNLQTAIVFKKIFFTYLNNDKTRPIIVVLTKNPDIKV